MGFLSSSEPRYTIRCWPLLKLAVCAFEAPFLISTCHSWDEWLSRPPECGPKTTSSKDEGVLDSVDRLELDGTEKQMIPDRYRDPVIALTGQPLLITSLR